MLKRNCDDTSGLDWDACTADWKYFDIITSRIGAPVIVADNTGQVVWSAKYLPYGKIYGGQTGSLEFNLRLPGQYEDSETGFYYNGMRYYIPEMRRYNRPEPIGQEGALDLYMYAGGNPVMMIDPTGLAHYLIMYGENYPGEEEIPVSDDADAHKIPRYEAAAKAKGRQRIKKGDSVEYAHVYDVDSFKDAIVKSEKIITGGIIFMGHGWIGKITPGVNFMLSESEGWILPKDVANIAKEVKKSGKFGSTAKIYLHSCQSGVGGNKSIAQVFANEFGVTTYGWTGNMSIWVFKSNGSWIAPTVEYRHAAKVKQKPFHPQKKKSK